MCAINHCMEKGASYIEPCSYHVVSTLQILILPAGLDIGPGVDGLPASGKRWVSQAVIYCSEPSAQTHSQGDTGWGSEVNG